MSPTLYTPTAYRPELAATGTAVCYTYRQTGRLRRGSTSDSENSQRLQSSVASLLNSKAQPHNRILYQKYSSAVQLYDPPRSGKSGNDGFEFDTKYAGSRSPQSCDSAEAPSMLARAPPHKLLGASWLIQKLEGVGEWQHVNVLSEL